MNLDEMLKALKAEATEKGEAILAEAKAEVNEILKEAQAEGEKLAAQSMQRVEQKLRMEKAKILSAANFDVKKEVLKAKEKVIDELFTKTQAQAKQDLSTDKGFFKGLAKEALTMFNGQSVKILVNKNSKSMAEEVLADMGTNCKVEDGLASIGGLKVSSEDSRVTVDNTIESRLEKIRQIYEPQIIKNLFGDEQ